MQATKTETTNRTQDLPDWDSYVVDREELRFELLRGLRDDAESVWESIRAVRGVLTTDPDAPAALASLLATLLRIRELQARLMGWD